MGFRHGSPKKVIDEYKKKQKALGAKETTDNIRSEFPNDKQKREELQKDKRKLNTRMRRIYDHIKKRKYETAVLKTQMKERNEFRIFAVEDEMQKLLYQSLKEIRW